MTAKRLKLVQAGYQNFTGEIGAYWFEDGVSVELIQRADRDRMCVAFQFEEVNDDGSSQPSGVAHRLVADAAARLGAAEPLQRQTDEEKEAEQRAQQLKAQIAPATIYSTDELVAIADKGGIKALREVADKWGVKHRSIPVLIEMVLEAQKTFTDKRDNRLEKLAEAEREALTTPVQTETETETETEDADEDLGDEIIVEDIEDGEISQAAATGDMSAAINAAQTTDEDETE